LIYLLIIASYEHSNELVPDFSSVKPKKKSEKKEEKKKRHLGIYLLFLNILCLNPIFKSKGKDPSFVFSNDWYSPRSARNSLEVGPFPFWRFLFP